MIKLTVKGVCDGCPWIQLQLITEFVQTPEVRCKHQTVCKYIEKEGCKDTTDGKKTP